MRVLVAGATGAIGRPLVRRLLAAGYEVVGTTRREERAAALRAQGAEAVVVDALDADALRRATRAARPDTVVQQLTDLPQVFAPRAMRAAADRTARLRVDGTRALVEGAPDARIVAQSIAFATAPVGPMVHDEDAPLWTDGPGALGGNGRALAAMEELVSRAGGVSLRYGFFYGPGTWYHRDGAVARDIARRRFPIAGRGDGCWSFVHVDDCVDATLLALDRGGSGVLNVTDDDPAPMREWLPHAARMLGAKRPLRVPVLLGRLVGGPETVHYATTLRGAANARAKERLGWTPAHPSWREGFAAELRQ